MYLYLRHKGGKKWIVGCFGMDGRWLEESIHPDAHSAMERANWLNGEKEKPPPLPKQGTSQTRRTDRESLLLESLEGIEDLV